MENSKSKNSALATKAYDASLALLAGKLVTQNSMIAIMHVIKETYRDSFKSKEIAGIEFRRAMNIVTDELGYKSVKACEKLGVLTIERSKGKVSRYSVDLEALFALASKL